jgi:hypothetical protein
MKCVCVCAICDMCCFCRIYLFSVANSGFISLQVLDMVLEDLKKEHPDAVSVVWLQCDARKFI